MYRLCTMSIYLVALVCICVAETEVDGNQQNTDTSAKVNAGVQRSSADLPDILLKGMIIVKIKTLSYIRELSYPDNNLTRRLTALCEKEMAKIFQPVKGKQTVKVESFRRGRFSAVILVMILDSTGNGNSSEIGEIIKKKINDPGKFINYEVDRRMASFRPQGVFCQPRVHYAFESSSKRNVYDDSGFDNNGVIYRTLEITRHGKCGKAAKFKNGYIYLRKFRKTKTSGTDAILVAFWMRLIKPRSSTSLFRGYYKGAVVELFMERGILKWKYITRQEAVAFLVRHPKLLKPRQWTHIVALYDPYTRKAKLFVDSELSNEADVRKGMIGWRFTSSLRFGMTSTEGYLDDLYVYDCILSEKVLDGIRKDCGCQELCAPRGKNEFLIRMILLSTNSSRIATQQLADRVLSAIKKMFEEISGQQRVQTIGHRPLGVDSLMVDYSLQSIGNSDTRYLAGVMQPAITAGKIAGVELTSNEVSFIPLSGKSVCLSNEMKCGDGECINKLWKCDGEINCADGSDEVNCGSIVAFDCQSNEFACNRSRVFGISDCIDARYRCDGQLDCDDDSDERGCVPPKLISAPRSLLIIAEGETASCTCVASGVPHPKVSWYFKGAEVLSIRGKISVTSVSGHGKLTIYDVGEEDSGNYICKISDNVVKKTIAPSCTIKVRAFGNVCLPPFFNSKAQRSDECLRCFCHERTPNCGSAQLYTSKVISRWDCESCVKDESILVNERGKPVNAFKVSTVTPLYWQLPTKYSGNKLASYGGNLKFIFDSDHIQHGAVRPRRDIENKVKQKPTVWNYVREVPNNRSWFRKFSGSLTLNDVPFAVLDYPESKDGTVSGPRSLNLTGGHSVFIVGDDGTHLGSSNLDYLDDAVFAVRVTENNWKEPQRRRTTSRPVLLRVLSNIKYIFIKASSSGDTVSRSIDTRQVQSFKGKGSDTTLKIYVFCVSRLLSVTLDTAVEEQSGEKVSVVEQCACPVGYSGLSCEKCAAGYFRSPGSQTCVKCSCNNHSDNCHPVTGKCEGCAHNTKGVKCEICKPGYYGNATKGTSHDCKKCNCPLTVETNTFSDLCYLDADGKSTCTQCQTGYTGRNCEFCAQGYEGNSTMIGSHCYKVGNFSQCDLSGGVSQSKTKIGEIKCNCKSNVVGSLCDTCREGTFNLQASNPSGCEKCFCSRKSRICTDFIASRFTIQSSFQNDYFKLATIYSKLTLPHSLRYTNKEMYLQRALSGEKIKSALYWHLPVKFSGSKVTSYGGFLEYTVTYSWNTTKKPSIAYDVILLGKKFGIKYVGRQLRKIEYQNGRRQTYRVALHEKFWRFSSDSLVSKIIFVLFLGRIDKLLILATPFVDMIETRLHDVKLDGAVESKIGVHIPGIERCSCPPAYTGYSCEKCDVGYTASGSSILGRCVKCNCHGHSSYCHPQSGVCQDCLHNATGKYCEKCKPGFYGNPKTRTPCQPCPCPRVVTTNSSQPVATCHVDNEGEPVCDQCPLGHEGKLCDRCKKSFTGNPKLPGGFCKPDKICEVGFTKNGTQASQCVPCECHSHSTQCDPRTGVCKDCEDNTSGNHCEVCTRGFYGDARKGLKNDCKPCPCPLLGSSNRFSETCFLDKDGLPTCDACFEGYSGRRCERCSLNYTGNPSTPGGKCFKVPVELIPTLKIIPESLTVQEGDSARFVCNVKSPRPTQIFWSKLDGQLISKRTTVEGNVLKFKSLQKQDGGTYLCTASNEIAVRTAKSVLVVKKQQLSAVIVDVSPKSRYIPVGGTAKFSCTSKTSSRYSITWSRENNKPLPSGSHVEDGTLIISDAKLSDGGTYICTGKNVLNVDRAIISLHVGVVVKPQVSVSPRKQIVGVADMVKFRCSATAGFPAATLVWKRDKGRPLPQFSKFFSRTGIFKIIAASRRDEGEYMCTARNSGGESVMRVQLLVKGPNSLPKAFIRPSRVTVGEGATAFLHCDVTGDTPMDIRWRKYDGTLPRTAAMKGNYLEIKRTTIRDRGRYVCTATNRYGEASAVGSLFVNKDTSMSPVVTIKPSGKVISVMEGKTLRLTCEVAGIDEASVRWTSQSNRAVLSQNSQLDLVKIKIEDTGIYECTATTDKGEGKASVSVVVQRNDILPRVQVYPTRVTTRIGKSVTFQCKVSSRLPVVVTWSRADGSSLNQNYLIKNTVLEIRNLRKKDEGTYICVAENVFGASKATVELSVFKR